MCLQSIGKDGMQLGLRGQEKGLEAEIMSWDGTRAEADYPGCGARRAFHFRHAQALAEGCLNLETL